MTTSAFLASFGPSSPLRHPTHARRNLCSPRATTALPRPTSPPNVGLPPGFKPSKRDGNLPGSDTAKKYRVEVRDPFKNTTHVVDVPEDRYIWSYMTESGVDVPSSCCNGCCTTCAVRVERGDVEQREALGLLRDMKQRGYALLCVSYPRSDIVCILQDEDEVYETQFGDSFESGGVEWGGVMPDEEH